jgi:hypothetical protein
LELNNGCLFAFPARKTQGLSDATAAQLAAVEVVGDGYALRWEDLDAEYTVGGLPRKKSGASMVDSERCAS